MNARDQYATRARDRSDEAQALAQTDARLANARLAAFVCFVGLLGGAVFYGTPSPGWSVVPLITFVGLIIRHARVIERREFSERAAELYATGLRRLDGHWQEQPHADENFAPPDHPYAADLDIFGKGSLFQLISMARTRAGEDALARWFLSPADRDEIRLRQEAVAELRDSLDLREDLALLGESLRARVRPNLLQRWATRPDVLSNTATLSAARLLTGAVILAAGGWLFFGFSIAPLILLIPLVALFYKVGGHLAHESLRGSGEPEKDLRVLAAVSKRIEAESFRCDWLSTRQETLRGSGRPASESIALLDRRLRGLEVQANQLFAPFALMLMWPFHFAASVERWRRESGVHVGAWLDAIGEIEAIASLSRYAFENPDDDFPEIAQETAAQFVAEELGHPLLPRSECVANDVSLCQPESLWIVSGSNMSGKSTLLRAVGIGAVMAFAGAPVRAARLRIGPMAIGASIATHDSIQSGRSRFYAEIQRIRDVVGLAETGPALFLIDEALHGTNSHDRRIGASAILQALVNAGAVGIVTTHDLALTEPLEQYGQGRAANWHFEDHLEDGELAFDYGLRPGVVQKSNAIELMRSVGLDV